MPILHKRSPRLAADLFADVLEKAGLVYLILVGKIVCEFNEEIDILLEREFNDRTIEISRGFYTRKGRELDGGRLTKACTSLSRIRNEIREERPDFDIKEEVLWMNLPSELSK